MAKIARRKQVPLTLSDEELKQLNELAKAEGKSRMAVLRTALKVYHRIFTDTRKGQKVYIEDRKTKKKTEFFIT